MTMMMSTEKFFSLLFRNVDKDFKVLFNVKEIGAKAPSKGARYSPHGDLTPMVEKMNAAKVNGYFHCGVDLTQERTLRLRNVDVDGAGFTWLDIDRDMTKMELESIQKDEFKPTIMVRSGNGYHLYWILSKFEANKQAITEVNRWLSQRFSGDTGVDVARLLRIPGTYNWKDPENPKLVEVVWFDGDAGGYPHEWDFDKFGRLASENKATTLEKQAIKHVPLGDFLNDKRMTEEIKSLITSRIGINDRSERDFRLADRMSREGFDANEIFSTLTHPVWASGDKGRESHNYAKGQAAESVARQKSSSGLLATLQKAFEVGVDPGQELTANQVAQGVEVKEGGEKTKKKKREPTLREKIMYIHEDVLQVGGAFRSDKHSPKFGGEFGRQVAELFENHGYRFVRDAEFKKNYIADRKGKVWEASGSDLESFICSVTSFASSQSEFSYISGGIKNYFRESGEDVQVGRWFHYDKVSGCFYILADDKTGLIYIVNSLGEISTTYNGEGSVFLRPRKQPATPLNLEPGVSPKESVQLLEESFTKFIAGSPETKRLMTCFTLASVLCYGSPVMTYPILHLTGPSGKGKSHTLGLMTSLLFGFYQLLTYTTAAAYRVVGTETLVAIDDKEEIGGTLEDYLLRAATASTRGICSNDDQTEVVLQFTHVINALTSIKSLQTVPLRRRALVIEINKELFPSSEVLKSKGIDNITERRGRIWSGLVPIMGKIATYFQNGEFDRVSERVYDAITVDDFRGQADFMALMLLIERELCTAVGRPFDELETLNGFLEVTGFSDREEMISRDPLMLCLESFFEKLFEEKTTEMYDIGEVPGNTVKLVTIHRMAQMQWSLTDDEENARVAKELGSQVRGIKASATGWVSIFSTDTKEFGRSINSPNSLGVQFKRLLGNKDLPFYIQKGRSKNEGRMWYVFQKLHS